MSESMGIEIAPGAALNDPRVQASIAERVTRRINIRRDDDLRIQHILANYPWREYGYKYGRWEWEETIFSSVIVTRYKWSRSFRSVELVDPGGRELSEMTSFWTELPALCKYSGRFLFAGDPAVAGVYSPLGDGVEKMCFVYNRTLAVKEVKEYALVMKPGVAHPALPEADLRPQSWSLASRKHKERMGGWPIGPWVVDHSDKPRKR